MSCSRSVEPFFVFMFFNDDDTPAGLVGTSGTFGSGGGVGGLLDADM